MQFENMSYDVLYPVLKKIGDEVEHMNVYFLLTHVPNPRINKRIEIIKHVAETKVICVRRVSQNIWEPAQDVEHIIFDIDLPSSKHFIKRAMISKFFQEKALSKLEEFAPNVIYAEGIDSLIVARKYKKSHNVKIIFEVADLRECYISKPKTLSDKVFTYMLSIEERRTFKSVDYLVVTSPKFFEMHYNKLISKEKMLFIPNAPDKNVFSDYVHKNSGAFTVGFIGGIRYLQQMKMLVDAAEETNCHVLFAGAGGTTTEYNEIREYSKNRNYVRFTGKYNYNTDIASLYSQVDCVYSVYDADNPNVRIALPNKLYEAILCRLPIIVAKSTYLAELVEAMGVGVAVNHKEKGELVKIINELKDNKSFYNGIVKNCERNMNSDSNSSKLLKWIK